MKGYVPALFAAAYLGLTGCQTHPTIQNDSKVRHSKANNAQGLKSLVYQKGDFKLDADYITRADGTNSADTFYLLQTPNRRTNEFPVVFCPSTNLYVMNSSKGAQIQPETMVYVLTNIPGVSKLVLANGSKGLNLTNKLGNQVVGDETSFEQQVPLRIYDYNGKKFILPDNRLPGAKNSQLSFVLQEYENEGFKYIRGQPTKVVSGKIYAAGDQVSYGSLISRTNVPAPKVIKPTKASKKVLPVNGRAVRVTP